MKHANVNTFACQYVTMSNVIEYMRGWISAVSHLKMAFEQSPKKEVLQSILNEHSALHSFYSVGI